MTSPQPDENPSPVSGAGDPSPPPWSHAAGPGEVACARCGWVHERCTAHKTNGAPCGQHPTPGGTGVCTRTHGNAPQVREKAQRRREEQRVRTEVATRIEEVAAAAAGLHPIETMEMARAYSHAMAQVLAEVQTETDLVGSDEGGVSAAAELFRRWVELAMRAGKTAADAGIDERRFALDEADADRMASLLRGIEAALLAVVLAAVPAEVAAAVRGVWQTEAPRVIEAEVRKVAGP